MMKRWLVVLSVLFLSSWMQATTWYATSSSANINAASLWVPTSTGSCTGSGTALTFGSQANGDVFDANGCTALAVNVDPGAATGASAGVCGTVTVTVTLQTNSTNGGAFTYATATNIVIHANITATKTIALAVSGSTGGLTICGNMQGGSTAAQEAVNDSHTSITVYVVGNITGGSATTTYGYSISSAGPLNVVGNSAAGTDSVGLESSGNATVTITGNCTGSNTTSFAGCQSTTTGAGGLVITGNIINGIHSQGVSGSVTYTPSATNYILSPADSSYTLGTINSHATEMPTNPGVTNVLSGVQYGSYTGTASGGGAQAPGCSTGWQ